MTASPALPVRDAAGVHRWASPALADHVNCGDVLTQDTTLDGDLALRRVTR